jgi:glycosyltransferase involved in cell wall biosynthesis
MRYVWDRYDDYFGPGRLRGPARWIVPRVADGLRAWDVATAGGVHAFVANSAYVAARIRRHYGRPARVIPPPVDTDFFTPGSDAPGDYDLVVSALAPYKRIDLVLEAWRGTGRALKIVGSGPEAAALRAHAPREAQFLSRVPDQQLRDLYRRLPGGDHARSRGLRDRATRGHGLRAARRRLRRGRRRGVGRARRDGAALPRADRGFAARGD